MTLVITDVLPWGIVMGADSALTITRGGETIVLTNAQKLRPIEHLQAGISFWGLGTIGGRYTHLWLSDFINTSLHIKTLKDFAYYLCNGLQVNVGMSEELMGFHLASYIEFEGEQCPQVFHVHNAHTDYPKNLTPVEFHIEESLPPSKWRELIIKYRGTPKIPIFELRNGDWYFYTQWLLYMERLIEGNFRAKGTQIPAPDLAGLEEYVRFKIKTIADLYKMSSSLKYVSEPIATLEISPFPFHSRYSLR